MMKDMDQEHLCRDLHSLTLLELKKALAAGVPGHAMHIANALLREKKAAMEVWIEEDGKKANLTVEMNSDEEVVVHRTPRIQTSKEGRKGNSRKVQE